MTAIEFHAVVKDGMIQVPFEHRDAYGRSVRVILMPDTSEPLVDNLLENLLANPLPIADFHPLMRDDAHAQCR
jgi:hypothetical protein